MKTASSQLATHLAGETTTLATCWKVTRRDGDVFGFTDHDFNLTVDGQVYEARTGYTRSAVHAIADLSVDNLDIDSALDSEALTAADLRAGVWDNAEILVFLVNWASVSQGKIILKRGTIGQVTLKDAAFTAEMRGLTQALSQQIGELYTPDCRADLGDTRCKIDLSSLSVASTVTAATDRYGFTDTARTEADDYWKGGLLTWTGGANSGRKMEIRSFASGVFTFFLPMPSDIAVGDGYSAQPGCDKSFSTCCSKYNNTVNFRGEPHVPGTDAVLSYPDVK